MVLTTGPSGPERTCRRAFDLYHPAYVETGPRPISHLPGRRFGPAVVIAVLSASLLALVLAPLALPSSYDWVSMTTSESGAQGVRGAWVGRLAFLLLGLGVLLLAVQSSDRWGKLGTGLHSAFGVLMIAVAAFSIRPWDPDMPYDRTEDMLHSVAATAMGFAFALGVIAVAGRRKSAGGNITPLDPLGVVAAVALPLAMATWGDYAGVFQRVMFVVAYLWYGAEAIRSTRTNPAPPAHARDRPGCPPSGS